MSETKTEITEKIKIGGQEFKLSIYNARKLRNLLQETENIINTTGYGNVNFDLKNGKIVNIYAGKKLDNDK